MAAGGYKEFVAGETLDQDEINDFLMQGMLVFAGTAARGSAIGTPVEGQFTYLKDTDAVEYYDGSAWVQLSTTPGAAVVSGTTGSPTVGTVSSGGTTYNVYSFTGDGSITFSDAGFAEILLVGGGGGGASVDGVRLGGGGGAGGYLTKSSAYFSAGTSTVIVGAGGPTGLDRSLAFTGESSSLDAYYAIAGSGGSYTQDGMNGGSAGGVGQTTAGDVNATPGNGTPGQGNAGGASVSVLAGAGGGGGASEAGEAGATNQGGAGGDGFTSSITGSSVARGGGGGGAGSTAGAGGLGGGGAGSNTGNATSGSVNTGGGGGGAYNGTGGAGGSGIVIVRVAV